MTPTLRRLILAAHRYALCASVENAAALLRVARGLATPLSGLAVHRPGWWSAVPSARRGDADRIDEANISLSEAARRGGVSTRSLTRYLLEQSGAAETRRVRDALAVALGGRS